MPRKIILGCLWLAVGMCGVLPISCFKEPPSLNYQDKKLVDSLYAKERNLLRVELDSLCTLHFETRVKQAVDSILVLRLKEREKLKSRQ